MARRLFWGASGIIQTIPGLALLAIMVPLLGFISDWTEANFNYKFASIGTLPALLALTLYSLLPILRNTVTGLLGVDEELIEAADAVGMTPDKSFFKVELIYALPVIFAGIRTATIWVIGTRNPGDPCGGRLVLEILSSQGFKQKLHVSFLLGASRAPS